MASKYWRKDENKPEIRNNKKIIERKIEERKKGNKISECCEIDACRHALRATRIDMITNITTITAFMFF